MKATKARREKAVTRDDVLDAYRELAGVDVVQAAGVLLTYGLRVVRERDDAVDPVEGDGIGCEL